MKEYDRYFNAKLRKKIEITLYFKYFYENGGKSSEVQAEIQEQLKPETIVREL